MTVMDFGCGVGTLVDDVVDGGAKLVVGVDTAQSRIEEARLRYGHLVMAGRADFLCGDVAELAPTLPKFDVILSKDTLEHVEVVSPTLWQLDKLLQPGGRMILGFSPLYYSPFGDHGFVTKSRWPWLHLIRGKRAVLDEINRINGTSFKSLPAAGLNGYEPWQFLEAFFDDSDWDVVFLRINSCTGMKGAFLRHMRWLAAVPGLARYFTVGLYVVLRRHP